MRKRKVLFVCIHNSARSVMAEAFLNEVCGSELEGQSAGLTPGTLNPVVRDVMAETGIDVSGHHPRSVFDVFKSGEMFAYVITVCDQASAERCPIFPGVTTRLHWSFPDPAACEGSREERMKATRKIRDVIRAQIQTFCDSICTSTF